METVDSNHVFRNRRVRDLMASPDDSSASVNVQILQCMLDLLPHSMLLISPDGSVSFANRFARREFDNQSPICLQGREMRFRRPQDVEPLRQAIHRASTKGRQCLLRVGGETLRSVTIAIAPVGEPNADGARLVMLVFGKRAVCEELSAEAYGREFGLTWTEIRVLKQLIAGRSPTEAAASQGVAISTMRTQIASIRDKTRANDIGALVREAALLPPLVTSLTMAA